MKHLYSDNHPLSQHFKYYEMIASSTAQRLDLPNVPSETEVQYAKRLAKEVLEPIRLHFGKPFSPTSWFRGEALERVICRKGFARWCAKRGWSGDEEDWQRYFARKSHPKGQAADIRIPTVPGDVLFDWAVEHLIFDQCIREFAVNNHPYSGWVHVSFSPDPDTNRQQAFRLP